MLHTDQKTGLSMLCPLRVFDIMFLSSLGGVMLPSVNTFNIGYFSRVGELPTISSKWRNETIPVTGLLSVDTHFVLHTFYKCEEGLN